METRKHFETILSEVDGKPFESNSDALDSYVEICRGCVLLAKEDLEGQDRIWEIASLARTFLHYAKYLEGFDHLLNTLYPLVDKMSDSVFDHPRLKLSLLRLLYTVLTRIEAQSGHELSMTEDVSAEIRALSYNIGYADKGEFDKIREDSVLKRDPVEWTARWEEIIDEADKMAYSRLEDQPRGMGFCFAFWHERKNALGQLGLEWRTPHQMNPRVLFD
ncbi:MAG: hypothetical protein ACI3ZS_06570 [Candidatus Cryptobacteroides sp.]